MSDPSTQNGGASVHSDTGGAEDDRVGGGASASEGAGGVVVGVAVSRGAGRFERFGVCCWRARGWGSVGARAAILRRVECIACALACDHHTCALHLK